MNTSVAVQFGRIQSPFTLTLIPDTIQNAGDLYEMASIINATNISGKQRAIDGIYGTLLKYFHHYFLSLHRPSFYFHTLLHHITSKCEWYKFNGALFGSDCY